MELKEVIHFYLGCKVEFGFDGRKNIGTLIGKVEPFGWQIDPKGSSIFVPTINVRVELIKPFLRSLSSIADDEKKEIFQIIFKRKFPDTGRIIWFEEKTRTVDSRWCLWSGVDRAVIEMDGTVWADCDLNYRKFNSHLITAYFVSKGFDLFNLIESGQAIDASTL